MTAQICAQNFCGFRWAGIKSICTEERGGGGEGSYDSYKCVQISVVNGPVPPSGN